jgi:MerR family copper efflux transcriptional regulator
MQHAREMAEHAYACRAHDVATCPGFRKHVDDLVSGATTWSVHPHPVVT